MSFNVNVETSQKKEIANILKDVAVMIENSTNKRITVNLKVDFE